MIPRLCTFFGCEFRKILSYNRLLLSAIGRSKGCENRTEKCTKSRVPRLFLVLAALPLLGASHLDPVFYPLRHRDKPVEAAELIFCTFDFLVWDSREDGLEYAYKNTQTQNDQDLHSYEPKSKFEPAFRVGFRGLLPYDEWTVGAAYTYYYTDRHQSTSHSFDLTATPGPGIISVWTYPSAFLNNNTAVRFEEADNRWKVHSSFVDLSLARKTAFGSRFTFTPEFGLRAAWIHQRYEVDYSSGNTVTPSEGPAITALSSSIDMNCLSNNVGPFFGFGANWHLGAGLNLFSNCSGALLASRFHIGRGETDLFLSEGFRTESIDLHETFWTFRPQGQLALGLRFLDTFSYRLRSFSYSFSAAYEVQIWWKQNGFFRYIDELNATSSGAYVSMTQGDLMLHGLTFEAGFNF